MKKANLNKTEWLEGKRTADNSITSSSTKVQIEGNQNFIPGTSALNKPTESDSMSDIEIISKVNPCLVNKTASQDKSVKNSSKGKSARNPSKGKSAKTFPNRRLVQWHQEF